MYDTGEDITTAQFDHDAPRELCDLYWLGFYAWKILKESPVEFIDRLCAGSNPHYVAKTPCMHDSFSWAQAYVNHSKVFDRCKVLVTVREPYESYMSGMNHYGHWNEDSMPWKSYVSKWVRYYGLAIRNPKNVIVSHDWIKNNAEFAVQRLAQLCGTRIMLEAEDYISQGYNVPDYAMKSVVDRILAPARDRTERQIERLGS